MKKILLASFSAAALAVGGGAWAQQSQPDLSQDPLVQPGAAGTIGQSGAGTTGTGASQAMPGTTSDMMMGNEYRSHAELGDDFDGQISGDFEADEIKDAKIVNEDGDEIGEVADLLVGADDRIEHVLVELSEEDGRRVAVGIDELRRAEGDASDELVVNKSKDELSGMTEYEQDGDRWVPKAASSN